jgi:hypothetical protein
MQIMFTYNCKEFTGELSQVQGAGNTSVYHLMIDQYYKGRLRLSAYDNRWVFDGEFSELADGFGLLLQLIHWIKQEVKRDEKGLFVFLTE